MKSRLWPKDNGIALVMVLWVLTLLSIVALEFSYAMRTEVAICGNYKDEIKGYFMARAGVERAILEITRSTYAPLKVLESGETKFEEAGILKGESPEMESETEIWKADSTPYEVSFRDGRYKVSIEDEGAKLNLNYATGDMLRQLLSNIEMPEVPSEDGNIIDIIADSILDWRDEDDLHRLNGAEDDYYNSLPEPYDCKDGPFDAVEELLLVRGITPEIYSELARYVTIYGRGKINLNTAPKEVLKSIPGIDDVLAEVIVEQCKEKKFLTLEELRPLLGEGPYLTLRNYITVSPLGFYTIKSIGQVEGSPITPAVKAVVQLEGSRVNVVNWMDRWWEIGG